MGSCSRNFAGFVQSLGDEMAEQKKKLSEHEIVSRRIAVEQAKASCYLSGLPVSRDNDDLDERWILGEITGDELVMELMRRYRAKKMIK